MRQSMHDQENHHRNDRSSTLMTECSFAFNHNGNTPSSDDHRVNSFHATRTLIRSPYRHGGIQTLLAPNLLHPRSFQHLTPSPFQRKPILNLFHSNLIRKSRSTFKLTNNQTSPILPGVVTNVPQFPLTIVPVSSLNL